MFTLSLSLITLVLAILMHSSFTGSASPYLTGHLSTSGSFSSG